jgi:hypothetical protein
MTKSFNNFINESIDYDLEIKKLEKQYPQFNLRYNIKENGIGAGVAYICSLYKNDKYLYGIKGPCQLKDCYELLKNTIKHEIS